MRGAKAKEESGPVSGDSLLWVSQGTLLASCVLWWGCAHAGDVLLALGLVVPAQPITSVDYLWDRLLGVWSATVVVAMGVFAMLFRMRRYRIDGHSNASWAYFGVGLTTIAAALVTARDVRRRDVSLDMWIVFLAAAAAFVQWFRERRKQGRAPRAPTGRSVGNPGEERDRSPAPAPTERSVGSPAEERGRKGE